MSEQRYFNDVQVGDELPPAHESASEPQLFLFSAATNNPHRIHYDLPFARSEGHPALLVHGPLQSAWMAKTLTNWAGPHGRLVRIATQNRGSAYPGEQLTFSGRVIDKHEEGGQCLVDLDVWEQKADGTVIMPGTATVSLPRR